MHGHRDGATVLRYVLKVTIGCFIYTEVKKLKKKLDDRRSLSKYIIQRSRQLSTPSTLQPPPNFVSWAVSRQFRQTTSGQVMPDPITAAEASDEELRDLPLATSTPHSSSLTSTPHSSSTTSTPHSSSLTSTHHSSSSARKSKRIGASQVCLSDVSTDYQSD